MLLVFKTKVQQAALLFCVCGTRVLHGSSLFLYGGSSRFHHTVDSPKGYTRYRNQNSIVDYRRIRKMCAPLNLYIIFS